MLIERLDILIREKKEHIGIDIKRETISNYYTTRNNLRTFLEDKYKVEDLSFSQLTENFIYDFRDYYLNKLGFQESSFYAVASQIKTVCRLAYREGLADTLLFANVKIARGDKKLPKALDRRSLDKLMNTHFGELEEEMETARDLFVFAFGLTRGVVKKYQISKLRTCLRDQISLFVKIINGLRFRSVFAVKFE